VWKEAQRLVECLVECLDECLVEIAKIDLYECLVKIAKIDLYECLVKIAKIDLYECLVEIAKIDLYECLVVTDGWAKLVDSTFDCTVALQRVKVSDLNCKTFGLHWYVIISYSFE